MFNNEFNLIAHRGYSEKSPENTIHSFDLALEKGFYNFEFDVQLTKDKIPIVTTVAPTIPVEAAISIPTNRTE